MQSTTSSTRTIMKPLVTKPVPKPKKPRKPIKLPKLSAMSAPGVNLPWFIVAILLVVSLFLFSQYRTAQRKLHPAAENAKQVVNLTEKVGKLAVLPIGETPRIYSVSNVDKLKAQTFFANAKDADKVLVYQRNNEAILYRPSTNQIVNIAPVAATPANAAQ
jgi:hypothetical protein